MRVRTATISWPGIKNGLLSRRWWAAMMALALVVLITPTTALAEEPWVSGWPSGQSDNEITTLAVDPSNERVIYASTNAALYRSTDGGASWKIASPTANIVALAIDPKNPDVVYTYVGACRPRAGSIGSEHHLRCLPDSDGRRRPHLSR